MQGPLPLSWWGPACRAAGGHATLGTALAIWFQVGVRQTKRDLKLTTKMAEPFGVSPAGKRRPLIALEGAGLIQVTRRGRKNPLVSVVVGRKGRVAA
jgi:hypothetical protein